MNVDVIILSNTADSNIWAMTQNCIDSIHASEVDYEFRVLVVETNVNIDKRYYGAEILFPAESFNYNRFLNKGIEYFAADKSEYIVLANNDLIFNQDWFTAMMENTKNNWDSACPQNPGWPQHAGLNECNREGYGIGNEFCGWCQVWVRESLDKLMPLDEEFVFWCQDDWVAWKSQKLGMTNVLVGSSHVNHLTSQSHRLIPPGKHHEWTHGMGEVRARKFAEGN